MQRSKQPDRWNVSISPPLAEPGGTRLSPQPLVVYRTQAFCVKINSKFCWKVGPLTCTDVIGLLFAYSVGPILNNSIDCPTSLSFFAEKEWMLEAPISSQRAYESVLFKLEKSPGGRFAFKTHHLYCLPVSP